MTAPLHVIAHEATRTGSPRVLADLLRHVAVQLPVPLTVELLAEGPLAGELRSFSTVEQLGGLTPAALMVNSAAAASSALRFGDAVPALAYVHEEGEALEVLSDDCRTALTERFGRVLCVSETSRDHLISLGVPQDRVRVLPPVVTTASGFTSGADTPAEVPPVVIGCGEAGWRKGADLFIDVARQTLERCPARFEWVGRRPRAFARVLDNDTSAVGLDDSLSWLGELGDLSTVFRRADLLVMTSREDPRPLVPLEAAAHGVATAGFATGGLTELAAAGAAATVPYPDTSALAAAVAGLLEQPDRRRSLAAVAHDVARTQHSIDLIGPQFLAELLDLLAEVPS